jgi:hypothetical protein
MVSPLTFTNGSQLTTSEQLAEVLYVAYLGRAGDPDGVSYWENNLNTGSQTIDQMAVSFGQQTETQALYPFIADPTDSSVTDIQNFITSIYLNLFNRDPDSSGLTYWTDQLQANQASYTAGTITLLQLQTDVADFVMDVARGAQNSAAGQDITTLMDKVTVASYFTNFINENAALYGISYVPGTNPVLDAISQLVVSTTDASAVATVAAEQSFINSLTNPGGPEIVTVPLDQGSIPGTTVALTFSQFNGFTPALTEGMAAAGTQSNVSITGFVQGDELVLHGTGGQQNVTVASAGTNVDIAYTDNSAAKAEHEIQLVGVLTAGQHPASVAQFDALFFGGIIAA